MKLTNMIPFLVKYILMWISVILQMMKHLFWTAQIYLLLRMRDSIHHLLFCWVQLQLIMWIFISMWIAPIHPKIYYPIGDTTVNCSSTDDAGNTGTCLLVVTVTGVNMIISISKSSVTNRAKDFGIFNFFWKMNRHQCICVLHFLTSRSFCLI